MKTTLSRRTFFTLCGAAASTPLLAAEQASQSLETPYKYGQLVLAPSGKDGDYDAKGVDSPFVFHHRGSFYMTFVAFDGIGYQTGLARSKDLVHWEKLGCILKRDPSSPVRKYNVAMNWILRENNMGSLGNLVKVDGRFVGAYHAYPNSGYENGAAAIGLAYSTDLLHWEPEDPILHAEDGDAWEHGGLYKPCLLKEKDTYYLFYNAKNNTRSPWKEQTGVATSSDLRIWTRYAQNPLLKNGGSGSPDEHFASDPCVLKNGPEWAFFYFGLDQKGVARDLVATGPDLLHPVKHSQPLIDVGPPGSVDSRYAHKPSIVTWKGDLYHFYCAVGGSPEVRGISVARSKPWRPQSTHASTIHNGTNSMV